MKKTSLSLFIITIFVIGIASNSSDIYANSCIDFKNKTETEEFGISNWWWDEMQVLSDESTAHSYQPRPAIDSEGNIHLVWHDATDILGSGSDYDIFYKKWDVNTETWGSTELLSTESTSGSDEPSIAIDSDDNLHVVWHDNTDILSCGTDWDIFYKTLDATTDIWGTTEIVSTESSSDAFDASFGIDQVGNIYVSWEDATDDDLEGDKDIYLKKKDAITGIWGAAEDVSSISNDASNNPHLVIDSNGDVHVAWIESFNLDVDLDTDVFYRVLDADTDTWSTTEDLSTVGTLDSDNVFLAVDSFDNIHVVYEDYSDYMESGIGEKDLFYKYKVSATGVWSPTELATISSTANSRLAYMTIDSTNKIHLVFQDATDIFEAGGDIDIFYTHKDSLTSDWAVQRLISTESIVSTVWGLPAIIIDSNGYYHVFWTDLSDIYGAGIDQDIFYRRFVGPPQAPHLYPISPNPTITGNATILWTDVAASEDYHIYREEAYISSLSGLSVFASTSDNFFDDSILDNGTYYYAVTTENEYGKSSISNIEYLQVMILDIDLTAGNSSNLLPFISDELLAIVGSLLGLQIIFFVVSLILKKK
ncbi:MAG: hypothetical protein ACTSVO_13440 [Candidatus Heimdallarchaeaceae archaeon]